MRIWLDESMRERQIGFGTGTEAYQFSHELRDHVKTAHVAAH